jgi:hypothetical protein
MDNDDLVAICHSIVEAGKMARPDMTDVDVDLNSTNSALRQIVTALKDIDAELANIKHVVLGRSNHIAEQIEGLAEAVRYYGE